MPITRKFVAQDQEENQILKMDSSSRYIVNDESYWQFLFGPNSELTNSVQVVKIAADFNANTLNDVKFVAYLYNQTTGSIDNAGSCEFKIYRVMDPNWTESLITTLNGTQLANNYWYIDPTLPTLAPGLFFGDETIMIEVTLVRLGTTYKDRVYVNHLGIYDNAFRLRQDVDFLDITKLDE
jgi:hypothetical protein